MELTNRTTGVTGITYMIQMRDSSDSELETNRLDLPMFEGALPGEDYVELADAFALTCAEAYRAARGAHHFEVTKRYIERGDTPPVVIS